MEPVDLVIIMFILLYFFCKNVAFLNQSVQSQYSRFAFLFVGMAGLYLRLLSLIFSKNWGSPFFGLLATIGLVLLLILIAVFRKRL